MKPKTCTTLDRLKRWTNRGGTALRRMSRELINARSDLPPDFSDIHEAIAACEKDIQFLSAKLDAAYEADKTLQAHWWNEKRLTDTETIQLLALNRRLRAIDPLLKSIAEDVTPRLEAKLLDQNDPMYDYEIEVRLDFILREDDPDYAEDDDNILTTRSESLKYLRSDGTLNYSEGIGPDALEAEHHCWRFHDLYDHDYGEDAPHLSLHDCLRVGKIYIDVQVWQQYDIDLTNLPTTDLSSIGARSDEANLRCKNQQEHTIND